MSFSIQKTRIGMSNFRPFLGYRFRMELGDILDGISTFWKVGTPKKSSKMVPSVNAIYNLCLGLRKWSQNGIWYVPGGRDIKNCTVPRGHFPMYPVIQVISTTLSIDSLWSPP